MFKCLLKYFAVCVCSRTYLDSVLLCSSGSRQVSILWTSSWPLWKMTDKGAHCTGISLKNNYLDSVILCIYRMLKEKVGQLWVGGYHQPFSQMDLKVLFIIGLVCVIQCYFCSSVTRKHVVIMDALWSVHGALKAGPFSG